MLSKIYYAIGGGIILIYAVTHILSMIKPPKPVVPRQAKSFKVMRMEKGKYVYVPPRPPSYPSSSGGSSYPSGGGYSSGK